jgi:hypothetical protein
MLHLERGSVGVEGRVDIQGEVHQRASLKGERTAASPASFETQALSSRGEPRFKTHSRRTSDEAQSSVYNQKKKQEPGTLLSRRRGENPRFRLTDAVEIRCHHRQVSGVGVDDGRGIQPQRKEFMAASGLAERAPQAHTGDSLISLPIASAIELLRVPL